MIKNVVDYLNYKENVRSHQASEAENIRSHMADETERNRHNVETERENYRHNTSTEALGWANYNEDVRSHKANEGLKSRELSIKSKDVNSLVSLRGAQKANEEQKAKTESQRTELVKQQAKTEEAKTSLAWGQSVTEGLVHQYYDYDKFTQGVNAVGNLGKGLAKFKAK